MKRQSIQHSRNHIEYNSLQETRFMFLLLVIAKLDLTLDPGENARLFLRNWMCTVQNRISRLHIQQRQLYRIATVDVLIGEEELPPQ